MRRVVEVSLEFGGKYYGDTEEDAKKILDEVKGIESVDLGFEDGEA